MMKQPLLSVIIPVYNTKPYLERCLNSVLNQTFKDFEVICVDDGSTDGSGDFLDEYALNDRRIKIIHKENGGLVSARKEGLSQTKGKYVAYVDSDDWIEPKMYEELVGKLLCTGAQIAASGFVRDYGSYTIVDNEKIDEGYYNGKTLQAEIIERLVDYDKPFNFLISPSLCNKVFDTMVLRKYQMPIPTKVTIDEDTIVTVPMIKNITGLYISDKSFYHYCSRENSMLNDKKKDEREAIEIAYQYMRSKIDIETSNYFENYARLQMCPETVLRYEQGKLSFYGNIAKEDRIVVYGAGSFGKSLIGYLKNNEFNVVAWVDQSGDGEDIIRPERIPEIRYDLILISVLLASIKNRIIDTLKKIGVREDSIRYIKVN